VVDDEYDDDDCGAGDGDGDDGSGWTHSTNGLHSVNLLLKWLISTE